MLTNKGFVRLDRLVHTLLLSILVVILLAFLFPLPSKMFDENLKVLLHCLDERNTPLFGRSFHLLVVLRSGSLGRKLHVRSSAAWGSSRKWVRERDKRRICTWSRIERVDQETSFKQADLGGHGHMFVSRLRHHYFRRPVCARVRERDKG